MPERAAGHPGESIADLENGRSFSWFTRIEVFEQEKELCHDVRQKNSDFKIYDGSRLK